MITYFIEFLNNIICCIEFKRKYKKPKVNAYYQYENYDIKFKKIFLNCPVCFENLNSKKFHFYECTHYICISCYKKWLLTRSNNTYDDCIICRY